MGKEFRDITELKAWLLAAGIDLSDWGRGGAKQVANLWDEYRSGEVTFEDDPPLRVVQVVQVIIRRGPHVLLEVEQEFGEGQRRYRLQPPSEKLKAGESFTAAAVRCLEEELGLQRADMAFLGAGGYRQVQATAESPSYPGLRTRYTFHSIEVIAKGLPNTDFWRENVTRYGADPVRRHRWAWQPYDGDALMDASG